MEPKNNPLIIALITLVIGLGVGYSIGNTKETREPSMSGMHGAMGGMMQGLSGKTGDELDKAFLDEMIVHHEGALDMAEALLAGTKRPELTKLGNDIITAQTKEIAQMKEWRATWFK